VRELKTLFFAIVGTMAIGDAFEKLFHGPRNAAIAARDRAERTEMLERLRAIQSKLEE